MKRVEVHRAWDVSGDCVDSFHPLPDSQTAR
jgi:hypothetical protein